MQCASAWSTATSTKEAVAEACTSLLGKLGVAPDYLLVFYTEAYEPTVLNQQLQTNLAAAQIQGCSSCRFVMTERGIHGQDGRALALWGMVDPHGNHGVGYAEIKENCKQAATEALIQAIENSDRVGESPSMIWMTASPGKEEELIAGIESMVGTKVPIFGGSAADDTVVGHWSMIANSHVLTEGVVLSVFYPSGSVNGFFHNGYSATEFSGRVTKANNRTIEEIDGLPAAEVYNRWLDGKISSDLENGGNILMQTTLSPLGRVSSQLDNVKFYNLSHPASVTSEQGLTLFTDINEGEEIHCMYGGLDSLVSRAGRVANSTVRTALNGANLPQGSLIIYCAGCMLSVDERMREVVDSLNEQLLGTPFIGGFTFGEQGCFLGGGNQHGNLMISVVSFFSE